MKRLEKGKKKQKNKEKPTSKAKEPIHNVSFHLKCLHSELNDESEPFTNENELHRTISSKAEIMKSTN